MQAEKVCAENGLTLEKTFVLFAEEIARLGGLPFEWDGFTPDIFDGGRDQGVQEERESF